MGRMISVYIAVVLLSASASMATVWYIKADGTGDEPTIQAGIAAAAAGDTVLLADGTYTGSGNHDISFMGKALTVRSESGLADACVIDCQASALDNHRAFNILLGEGPTSRIEGIMMKNGNCSHGGAVRIHYSSPVIQDCVLCGNRAGTGGAVHIYDESYPTFQNCVFLLNSATTGGAINAEMGGRLVLLSCTLQENTGTVGGAINGYGVGLRLEECIVTGNSGYEGGAIVMDLCGAASLLTGCTFAQNEGSWGGAIYSDRTSESIEGCTFVSNSGGHGAHIYISGGEPTISNCILAYGGVGSGVYVNDCDRVPVFSCCDIYGNAGGDWIGCIIGQYPLNGNFSACPSFCNAAAGDFHMCDQSPCLPGNHPVGYECVLIGAWGQGCVCGPSLTEPASWGAIKSIYR